MFPTRWFDPGQGDRLEALVGENEGSFHPAGESTPTRLGADDERALEHPTRFFESESPTRSLLAGALEAQTAEVGSVERPEAGRLDPQPSADAGPECLGLGHCVWFEKPLQLFVIEEEALRPATAEKPVHPLTSRRDGSVAFGAVGWKSNRVLDLRATTGEPQGKKGKACGASEAHTSPYPGTVDSR